MKNIKHIEKIAKAYEKIKQLDADILQLDKMAMKLADGVGKVSVSIQYDEPENKGLKLDEDGSIINETTSFKYGGLMPSFMFDFRPREEQRKGEIYSEELTENMALNFLGMLISTKMQLRNELIKSIEL